jgi:hypothetical protein
LVDEEMIIDLHCKLIIKIVEQLIETYLKILENIHEKYFWPKGNKLKYFNDTLINILNK